MPVLLGTSGWQYDDWRGVLYDEGVPRRRWLEVYARSFRTVENNNVFYRLPEAATFAGWRESTPPGFVMAVKASRYLTHVRRLRDPGEPVARLMERARGLGGRLGPVLLQLPPTLRGDAAALDAVLGCFPGGVRVAVEPRHPSWWTAEVRGVLAAHGAALCWADRGSRPVSPLWRTADWGYLRLHEGRASPRPRYGPRALDSWAGRLADAFGPGGDVYAYFDNDTGGAAVLDARAFARRARERGLRVPSADGDGPGGTPRRTVPGDRSRRSA
ncbi:DUF72 domain-containing protein [Streptomyces sp. C10-9-1]|uniref:DUF72 domain-containing protein n=1 Tax=Streptomyces sp. C10-9-1 TaxID=1859285 RepID=UPI0021117DCB|nr:DUF72 domain-containing protein [Streptomyces sp. C10-9-1]MCQ6556627.1 DUF72 domain-containing protein [Streptomyces sp. C10-9-1]